MKGNQVVSTDFPSEELVQLENPELLPTKTRIMGAFSYFATWFGGCVCLATFATGANLIGALNFTQAFVAIVIGNVILAVALVLAGKPGEEYGIPFSVQLRSSFGFSGSKVPAIMRAIPALIWFGYQSWIGAVAINTVLDVLFNFNNVVICFACFQALQVVLSLKGFSGIKWLENIAAVFLIAMLVYMFYTIRVKFGTEISDTIINIEGSWGLPFWAGVTSFLGIFTALVINVSDYSRNYHKGKHSLVTILVYIFGLLPANVLMGLMGLMMVGATGSYDPVAVFTNAIDNPFVLVVTLFFIIFSQITTNVLNNMVPPIYICMDFFKWNFKKSAIVVGILAVATCPWLLVQPSSAAGLDLFIHIYAAFLGPIFAVLVVDYFVIYKKKLNINAYYDRKGVYKGVNWAGIISICVGAVFSTIFIEISWFVSLIPSGVTYYLLMKKTKMGEKFIPR